MSKKKYYAIIDCETCTIPRLKEVKGDKAGLEFPLIYDLAVEIIDRDGTVYWAKEWLIAEIFSSSYFDTGYYASKRPIYLELLKQGKVTLTTWDSAKMELLEVMTKFETTACAYNAFFDFKKAFHSTNRLIRAMYSSTNTNAVRALTTELLNKKVGGSNPYKGSPTSQQFWLIDQWFEVIDIWNFACDSIFQTQKFKQMAIDNGWYSEAGNFKTNAEVAYRFISGNTEFIEEHTAMADVVIEGEILAYIFKHHKIKVPYGIVGFPWRKVGKIPKK